MEMANRSCHVVLAVFSLQTIIWATTTMIFGRGLEESYPFFIDSIVLYSIDCSLLMAVLFIYSFSVRELRHVIAMVTNTCNVLAQEEQAKRAELEYRISHRLPQEGPHERDSSPSIDGSLPRHAPLDWPETGDEKYEYYFYYY
eukprot:g24002.t1